MKALLAAGADPDAGQENGWAPLHTAATHGDDPLVDTLLDAGASPDVVNVNGVTPADLADKAGRADLARRLRGQG